jgi:hypothetical protein
VRFEHSDGRSLYQSGSVKTVTRGLVKQKADTMRAPEVRCNKGGTATAEDFTLLFGN